MRFRAFAALCSFRCPLPPVFAAARSTQFVQRHLFTLRQHVFWTLKKFQPAHVSETRFVISTTISSFFCEYRVTYLLEPPTVTMEQFVQRRFVIIIILLTKPSTKDFNITQICICWTCCFTVSSLCNFLYQRLLWGPTLRRPGNLQHVSVRYIFSEPLRIEVLLFKVTYLLHMGKRGQYERREFHGVHDAFIPALAPLIISPGLERSLQNSSHSFWQNWMWEKVSGESCLWSI
jgi:hypothetical protein